jgi:WD40 repeat protein/serine/threonine protein kinase
MTPSAPEPQAEGKADVVPAKGERQPALVGQAGLWHPETLPSVPDHELLRCIGRGAYGAVWLARNVMGTFRAVKIVHREDFGCDRPFIREFEGLLKFEPISRSHLNLMQILHVGRRDSYFYYVTELADDARDGNRGSELRHVGVEDNQQNLESGVQESETKGETGKRGEKARTDFTNRVSSASLDCYVPRTLQADLECRGRLPVKECVSLATALASALKHLHGHALVHRDVKPSNVIFVHGVPKLADIGLVATVGESRSIVGTEGYLPPEGPGSPQADLYALGKLLYEASTGLSCGEYPRLPMNLSALPDAAELLEFNELLLKACAKDTPKRYHQAEELLADLALLERGDSVRRLRRLERYHVLLKRVGVVALGASLLISAAWWQSWRGHRLANRLLAKLHVNEGTRRMATGDYAAALPWLVGALELEAGDPERERIHRARIAGILQRCPLPVAHFGTVDTKVLAADLNLDGTLLATAHDDGSVRLWNTRSGNRIQELRHNFPPVFCQFLPPGDRLLAATIAQKAYVWDLARPEAAPRTFAQAMDVGGSVYSVGVNGQLGWVYLSKGRHCFPRVHPLTVAPENLTLSLKLVGKEDVLYAQYEVRRTKPPGPVLYQGQFNDTPAEEPFVAGRDSPAEPLWGRVLLFLENSSLGESLADRGRCIWDNVRARRYPSGEPPPAWRVLDDFSGGSLTNWFHFALPGEGRSWRTENGQLVLTCRQLPRTQTPSGCVLYLETFEILRMHTLEVEVDLVSVEAPHPMASLTLCSYGLDPYTTPDRAFVAHDRWFASTDWQAPIRIWDLERAKPNDTLEGRHDTPLELHHNGMVRDIDFSLNTNWVAVVTRKNRLSVWEFRTGIEITLPTAKQQDVTDARFSPDGRFLTVSHEGGLELVRTRDWQPARTLVSGSSCDQPRFSPRGGRLAAVRDAREVLIWNLDEPEEPVAAFPHPADIQRIVFSPDGRYLVTSTANAMIRVWDVVRGEAVGPPLPGTLARFSPEGTELLIFGGEGGVWLWDLTRVVDDRLLVPALRGEQGFVSSRDRAMAARIESQDISLDTPVGQYSLTLPFQASLHRVAFTPDERFLIAESSDHMAWVWDLSSRTLVSPPRPIQYDAALETHALPQLPTESRDERYLSDLVALLGQQRPDGRGGMIPISDAERARIFGDLKQKRSAEFETTDASRMRWHQEQASSAELAMDWDAAVFHWERVLDNKSGVEGRHSGVAPECRLAYGREAAEMVREAVLGERSRWSVILPRPPWAMPAMLDLGKFYTTPLGELRSSPAPRASFRDLGSRVQTFGGTGFDVRGIIDLKRTNHVFIPLGRACQRIHFLDAASRKAYNRETVGTFRVTYANHRKTTVTMLNPGDVPSFSFDVFHEVSPISRTNVALGLRATLVWCGFSSGPGTRKEPMYLTRTTWELPASRQGEVVESIELEAGPADSALLIFAITVE